MTTDMTALLKANRNIAAFCPTFKASDVIFPALLTTA